MLLGVKDGIVVSSVAREIERLGRKVKGDLLLVLVAVMELIDEVPASTQ